MASQASILHPLLREILGKYSDIAVTRSNAYALSIANLDTANSTARDILQDAMDSAIAAFGDDSPVVGMQRGFLGRIVTALGDADEGLRLLQGGLSILEAQLSEETRFAFGGTADDTWQLLHKQGRLDEAVALCQRVAASCEAALGPTHILTCEYLVNVGFLLLSRNGAAGAAAATLRNAIERLEGTVGAEHPETLRAMGNLASAYRAESRLEDSIRMTRRVLAIREKKLGPTSRPTLLSMSNLGASLHVFGAAGEAKAVLEEAQRRLQDPAVAAACGDVVLLISNGLARVEAADLEVAHSRIEEHVRGIDLSPGALLTTGDADAVASMIELHLSRGQQDDAYRLARQAGNTAKTLGFEGAEPVIWDFYDHQCTILDAMPGREDQLVEACREALARVEANTSGMPATKVYVKRELALGAALLKAGQQDEGVRTVRRGMVLSKNLEDEPRSFYRTGFSHLFRHYTHETLSGDNVDLSSRSPEYWDRIVGLLEPERGANLD